MKATTLNHGLSVFFCLFALLFSACQAGKTANGTTANRSLAPQRVDIRGSIVSSRYDQGQVMLEVEAFGSTPDSRYTRAYVLVLPTAQMVGPAGESISINELRQGQQVAILLRGGGRGNFTGVGVARKLWVEERF